MSNYIAEMKGDYTNRFLPQSSRRWCADIMGWLFTTYAVLASFAFLVFPLFWIVGYGIKGNKKAATRLAADITMIFLIGGVSALYDGLFNSSYGFWIVIFFLLLMAGLIGNAQNRIRGKINPYKIGRAVWRLGFIVLSFLYLLFFVIELIILIIQM